jgi:predicted nucleic acid-binding protein
MNLIVDTSVWSYFLRRKKINNDNLFVKKLYYYIQNEDQIHLLGIVLLEILDGIKSQKQFELLINYFGPFPLIDLTRNDFIEAAKIKNKCRKQGIQASSIDFLITSVCINRNYPLLTADKDFKYISKHCSLILL